MKVSMLINNLLSVDCYKSFISKFPEAFFCAGFFVIDLVNKSDKFVLDYFIPEEGNIVSFEFPFINEQFHNDKIVGSKPQSLSLKVDIDDLELKCNKVFCDNNISFILSKIIAILKNDEWNLTCMGNTLDIIRVRISAVSGEVLSYEKINFFDMANVK